MGAPVCARHGCRCGAVVGETGHHGLCFMREHFGDHLAIALAKD